jgi:phage shock protein A
MKWLERFTFVMKSSVTALRERIEDPERMLHQLVCDMEEELEIVRESVAASIADEIQIAKQIDAARSEAQKWMERAEAALKRGDEAGAKSALDQRIKAEERVDTLAAGYEKQKSQVEKLQASYRDLEDKIRQARHKRTLLVARLTRAQSSDRINRALDRAAGESAFAEFSRLERKVDRAEAMSDAYDRLDGKDPAAEELAAQFDAEERRRRLEAEFEELRRRTAAGTGA